MAEIPTEIKNQILHRFAQVALKPQDERKFPVGPASAIRLGYDPEAIRAFPLSATESFAGVGDVFSLGACREGEVVLDLGCGAGLDTLLAARQVGPTGKIIGLDFSPAMVEKARCNISAMAATNAHCRQSEAEALPLPDASVDLIISNGVFNLCSDKTKVLTESFRVLKPGGRIQMADVLLHESVTSDELSRMGVWSD